MCVWEPLSEKGTGPLMGRDSSLYDSTFFLDWKARPPAPPFFSLSTPTAFAWFFRSYPNGEEEGEGQLVWTSSQEETRGQSQATPGFLVFFFIYVFFLWSCCVLILVSVFISRTCWLFSMNTSDCICNDIWSSICEWKEVLFGGSYDTTHPTTCQYIFMGMVLFLF